MNKNCQFIRDIVHIIDLISSLSRKAEKKIVILNSFDISHSIAIEIHSQFVNIFISIFNSFALYIKSSSESESRSMIDEKVLYKIVP